MEEEKSKEFELSINLKDFWYVFLRCWWVMAIVAVAVGAALYGFLSFTHKDQFTAQAKLYVMREKQENSRLQTADVSISNNLIDDCVYSVHTDYVLDRVIENTGTKLTKAQLTRMISAANKVVGSSSNSTSTINSHYVLVAVTAADPQSAQTLANEVSRQTCSLFEYVFDGESYVKIVDEAELPVKPSNPISKRNVLLIAFAGAVLVYALYFVLFLLDDKVNDAEDVRKYLDVNVLGQIPNRQDARRRKKGSAYYAYSADGEKIRLTKTNDNGKGKDAAQ